MLFWCDVATYYKKVDNLRNNSRNFAGYVIAFVQVDQLSAFRHIPEKFSIIG